jgi:hypothetical protein
VYDVDAACAESGRRNGAPAERFCLRDEQRSYDHLRLVWSDVAPQTLDFCMNYYRVMTARGGGFRYTALADCIAGLRPIDELKRQGPFRP